MSCDVSPPEIGRLEEWEAFGVARRRARISQVDIAAASGVPQPVISGWEVWGRGVDDEKKAAILSALERLLRVRAEERERESA